MDADRCVAVAAGIDDHTPRLGSHVMDEIDHAAFEIALMEDHLKVQGLGQRPAVALDIGQRLPAMYLRLARADQVGIGSVDDVDQTAHGFFP